MVRIRNCYPGLLTSVHGKRIRWPLRDFRSAIILLLRHFLPFWRDAAVPRDGTQKKSRVRGSWRNLHGATANSVPVQENLSNSHLLVNDRKKPLTFHRNVFAQFGIDLAIKFLSSSTKPNNHVEVFHVWR